MCSTILEDGLVQSSHNSYEYKRIKATVEGSMGNWRFTGWIETGLREIELLVVITKIKVSHLMNFTQICIENELLAPDWSKKKFDNGLWKYVDGMEGYHYNQHKSPNGDSKSGEDIK